MKKETAFIVSFVLCTISCEEIISVDDLSAEKVVITAPRDGATVNQTNVNLSWEAVDYAEGYHIQVATPNFQRADQILLDTLTVDSIQNGRHNILIDLDPAVYEWRIQARNSAYETAFTTAAFSVDSSSIKDISEQEITTISPADGTESTGQEVKLDWESLDGATGYQVQVARPNFDQATLVVKDTTVKGTTVSLNLENGPYEWRIRGENALYRTPYTKNAFVVNRSDENNISGKTVNLLAPAENTVLAEGEVKLSWEALDNANSYILQLATPDFDNTRQLLLDEELNETTNKTLNLSAGSYSWRVRAKNTASETVFTLGNFTVQMEMDISNGIIDLLAPADYAVLKSEKVALDWTALDGATSYTVQIATPDFQNPNEIMVNETVYTNSAGGYTLGEGDYEWRVKGVNAISETGYTTRRFRVTQQGSLTGRSVTLTRPANNATCKDPDVGFAWERLDAANLYRIRITNTTDNQVLTKTTTTETVFNYTFTDTGDYKWEVRAENGTQSTVYTSRFIKLELE